MKDLSSANSYKGEHTVPHGKPAVSITDAVLTVYSKETWATGR